MAQVLVEFNIGYSNKLVLENKDAMALMKIMSRATEVRDTYTDNKVVYVDRSEVSVRSMFNVETMTEDEFSAYKEQKAAAEDQV